MANQSGRIIVRIELSPKAKEALEGLSGSKGMTQVAMLSRLVEWFSERSELIQASVLGQYPVEHPADVGRFILKEMTGGK